MLRVGAPGKAAATTRLSATAAGPADNIRTAQQRAVVGAPGTESVRLESSDAGDARYELTVVAGDSLRRTW
ncbi:MAG: hypothetical protein M3300_11045 [Actinomycetota bacterium]|nr:hypothetical protein [Actinomycetota bacterium]